MSSMSSQPENSKDEQEPSPEFQRFDNFMRKLARVPASEVREKIKKLNQKQRPNSSELADE